VYRVIFTALRWSRPATAISRFFEQRISTGVQQHLDDL
jgi:hypothetical protein